jgi:hypothetical protein
MSGPIIIHLSLSPPLLFYLSLSILLNTFTTREVQLVQLIPFSAVMETRPDSGVVWLPRKAASFLILVLLFTLGSAHLFPASESTKSTAPVQPPGTVAMVMIT